MIPCDIHLAYYTLDHQGSSNTAPICSLIR
jgi:hypothetical protein